MNTDLVIKTEMQQETLDQARLVELMRKGNLKTTFCRLCLAENSQMIDVHETYINDKQNSVTSILNALLLKVDPYDKYPSVICEDCLNEVIHIFNFKSRCLTAMEKLNDLYKSIENNMSNASSDDSQSCILIVIPKEDEVMDDHNVDMTIKQLKSQPEDLINSVNLNFLCKICREQFVSTKHLQIHMLVSHNIENYDEYCKPKLVPKKKQYKIKQSFCVYCGQKQYKGFHSKTEEFKCNMCKQIYPCKGLLNHHIENIHSSDKLSNELTAKTSRKGIEIQSEVNQESLNCNVCNRMYYTIAGLHKHMSSHFNVFICDYCGVKYTLKDNLKRHILIKHMKSMKFFCKLCQKGFLFFQEYVNHQTVHTKERSFQCHVCGKNFVAKSTLVNHMRLHTGERPYRCTLCDESFVSATRLSEHKQVKHIGKLKCPKCSKEFTRKESVTKHMKLQRCCITVKEE